jgi:hypothetical protein
MLRNLAVTAVVASLLLSTQNWAQAQTIGSNFGVSGGLGAAPVVPLGGIAGSQTPLPLSNDPTAPNLRGSLPVFSSPELTLPAELPSPIAGDGQADRGPQDTRAMPRGSETGLGGDVRQNLGQVTEFSHQAAVATGGGEQDDEAEDEDPEEGETPWWVFLLVVVGVAVVVSRLRGGGARG